MLISQAQIDPDCGATLLHSGLWANLLLSGLRIAHARDQ